MCWQDKYMGSRNTMRLALPQQSQHSDADNHASEQQYNDNPSSATHVRWRQSMMKRPSAFSWLFVSLKVWHGAHVCSSTVCCEQISSRWLDRDWRARHQTAAPKNTTCKGVVLSMWVLECTMPKKQMSRVLRHECVPQHDFHSNSGNTCRNAWTG